MKKAKIAIVGLGHYIYFNQFEGLREELMQKSEDFKAYLDTTVCDVLDLGYADCVENAFEAVQRLKREDADLLFVIMSTYVPSAVCALISRDNGESWTPYFLCNGVHPWDMGYPATVEKEDGTLLTIFYDHTKGGPAVIKQFTWSLDGV